MRFNRALTACQGHTHLSPARDIIWKIVPADPEFRSILLVLENMSNMCHLQWTDAEWRRIQTWRTTNRAANSAGPWYTFKCKEVAYVWLVFVPGIDEEV